MRLREVVLTLSSRLRVKNIGGTRLPDEPLISGPA